MKKLHIETAAANAVIESRKKFVELINALSEELKTEGITLTPEIVSGIISGGLSYLANLFVQSAVEQYKVAGIQVNSDLMATLKKNSNAVASDPRFTKLFIPLQQVPLKAGIGPDQVTIKDGNAVFTKSEEREIIEAHTSYLKKEDVLLYEKLDSFVQSINEMSEYLKGKVDLPLGECMRRAYQEKSFIIDANHKLQLRKDLPLIVDSDGSLVVNDSFFGAR